MPPRLLTSRQGPGTLNEGRLGGQATGHGGVRLHTGALHAGDQVPSAPAACSMLTRPCWSHLLMAGWSCTTGATTIACKWIPCRPDGVLACRRPALPTRT